MTASVTYLSFLVRMWKENGPHPQGTIPDWHSEVEHIQSGQQWTFHTLEKLLDFVQQVTENPKALTSSQTQIQHDAASR